MWIISFALLAVGEIFFVYLFNRAMEQCCLNANLSTVNEATYGSSELDQSIFWLLTWTVASSIFVFMSCFIYFEEIIRLFSIFSQFFNLTFLIITVLMLTLS